MRRAPELDPGPEMPRSCWSELGYWWELSGVRALFDSPLDCAPRRAPDRSLPRARHIRYWNSAALGGLLPIAI